MSGFRYGPFGGGPDPLEPPFDVAQALDDVGNSVLRGASARDALRDLLRRGTDGLRGLEALRRDARRRAREARQRGRLDGTLEEVQALLEQALEAERSALFPDPSDDARLAESELDALPNDTARAVRQLRDRSWRSPEAESSYRQIEDLLRREVLDSQFQGMKDGLAGASPQDMARVKDVLADLNAMLAADARGEDTTEAFDQFMERHGDFFPERPQSLDELVDALARRAAAQQRLMQSLSPEQRQELANLMAGAMADTGLASELDQLGRALRSKRPDMDWDGQARMRGEQPLGMGDATTALAELADLEELEATTGQSYPGASMADIDEEMVARALGRAAVDDLAALRRVERELEAQGYLTRRDGQLELTPRAVRRIGATALRRVFASLESRGRGSHDVQDAGAAGELTGASRQWRFGDEQPLDVVRTVRNSVLRTASQPRTGRTGVRLAVEDFEVVETERRTQAAVALLVDMSYSMVQNDTWGEAKTTALALHSLVTTRYPQDAMAVIGFNIYAAALQPTELAGLEPQYVQGTNLQHALMMAGRHLAGHPDAEPVVLVVTDGEPTAHLERDGEAVFDWPPTPRTLELTMAEVDRLTRRGAQINVFMLGEQFGMVEFVDQIAQRNGGRVFSPDPARLGEYVVDDYLRARRGRRAAAARRRAGGGDGARRPPPPAH